MKNKGLVFATVLVICYSVYFIHGVINFNKPNKHEEPKKVVIDFVDYDFKVEVEVEGYEVRRLWSSEVKKKVGDTLLVELPKRGVELVLENLGVAAAFSRYEETDFPYCSIMVKGDHSIQVDLFSDRTGLRRLKNYFYVDETHTVYARTVIYKYDENKNLVSQELRGDK